MDQTFIHPLQRPSAGATLQTAPGAGAPLHTQHAAMSKVAFLGLCVISTATTAIASQPFNNPEPLLLPSRGHKQPGCSEALVMGQSVQTLSDFCGRSALQINPKSPKRFSKEQMKLIQVPDGSSPAQTQRPLPCLVFSALI